MLAKKKYSLLLLTFAVGVALWWVPPPEQVEARAWHLFAIFVATIFGIIANPLPMGCMALIGIAATVITKVLTFQEAFSGFGNEIVWLIVFAFFISRGFIKTGLGARISFLFMRLLGKKTLGLGYGLVLTELILAPAIPSNTARSGGVILPIIKSLANVFESKPHQPTAKRMGAYLTTVSFQATCITSAMFLTSMAGNPLIVELAQDLGITITWGSWAIAAIVPGLISLAVVPYAIFKLYPPTITESPHAPEFAKEQLHNMGKIRSNEWIMLGVFIFLIGLWIMGPTIGIKATVTALLGLVILLITNVLTWQDIRQEEGAWETLIWFSILLTMATQLNKLGLTQWFSNWVAYEIQALPWISAYILLTLVYFYSHYFFASNLAHIGAMYATFLAAATALGAPLGLSAMTLAFYSSLFGGLTQYSSGPAALLFGAGYVPVKTWWKIGFIMSIITILIWQLIGGLWWYAIGLFDV